MLAFLLLSLLPQLALACNGQCMDKTQCLAAGKRYMTNQCLGGNSNVCCLDPIACFPSGDAGLCRGTTYCSQRGGTPVGGHCPGTTDIQCCQGAGNNIVNNIPPPDNSVQTCTAYGRPGECKLTSECDTPNQSYPASTFVIGCKLIKQSNIQCCAAAPTESPTGNEFSACRTAGLLRRAGFNERDIPKMVCTAFHESRHDCTAVGSLNSNGSRDYGLFQANSMYWCSGGDGVNRSNGCNIACSALSNCEAAARCAKTIFDRQGISAWAGYNSHRRECDSYVLPGSCAAPSAGDVVVVPNTRAPTPSPDSGQTQPQCHYRGVTGQCKHTSGCSGSQFGNPLQSIRSRDGAQGCGHIPDPDIRCCVAPPPQAVVPSLGVPAGRSCALARPSGCSAFRSTFTINIKFADEIIRVNSHALNAGAPLVVTSSFRTSASEVGASTSRHRVGFAIDMNPNGCNSACMCPYPNVRNSRAKEFLRRVIADSTLHWGGNPQDPVNYNPGGCVRDSVHIQSRNYHSELSRGYSAERNCLNAEHRRGRFETFSCRSGVALLTDSALEDEENGVVPGGDAVLSTPAIVGIAIGACICCALIVAIIVAVRMNSAGDEFVSQNELFHSSSGIEQNMDVFTSARNPSERTPVAGASADNFHSAVFQPNVEPVVVSDAHMGTVRGSNSQAATGLYTCDACGKSYDYAEDLAEHAALRH